MWGCIDLDNSFEAAGDKSVDYCRTQLYVSLLAVHCTPKCSDRMGYCLTFGKSKASKDSSCDVI